MTAPTLPVNTPSKPQVRGAATGRSQADRRYMDTFHDNHRHPHRFPTGRPWCGPREIAANTELLHEDGFCIGDLMQGEYIEDDFGNCDRAATLGATWTAPWVPLAKYRKFIYPRKRIIWEYDRMLVDEKRSTEEYYHAAAKLGAKLNVRVAYGVVPDFQITADLGEPTKFLKIAEAAMAGDPWLLGFIDDPNPELATILGYNQRGLRVLSYEPPKPEPIVTPAQILATPDNELMKMIAEMAAQAAAKAVEAALEARETKAASETAKKQGASNAALAEARAAKAAKRAASPSSTASTSTLAGDRA